MPAKRTKPRFLTKCPANAHTMPHERIAEFFDPVTQLGGLISIRRNGARLTVEVYRCSDGVDVYGPESR